MQPPSIQIMTSMFCNVYYIRKVRFDEGGRLKHAAKPSLMADMLGVYHVGLEVHGTEYTFGNYHAKNSRPLGGVLSGVCAHDPQRAGPRYVLKEKIYLGTTAMTPGQVSQAAEQLGSRTFTSATYNKVHHNCTDFARSLGALLGATDLPFWCHRASSTARWLINIVSGVSSCMIPSVDADEVSGDA